MRDERSLDERIADILDGLGGQIAFAARRLGARRGDPMPDQRISLHANEDFPAADLARLPIAVEVMRRVDLGQYRLAEQVEDETASTLGDLCVRMLAENDDAATEALLDLVGLGEINETLSRMKLERTKVALPLWEPPPANAVLRGSVTCADDMMTLMGLIAGRALPGSQRLLTMLETRQRADAPSTSDLPPDARLAHCGSARHGLVHDAGVLTGPGGACVYCMLSAEQHDVTAAGAAIGETLRTLWAGWRLGPDVG